MLNEYALEKLTKLLIEQDVKDKKIGQRELISKFEAFKSLIKLLKEVGINENNNN